MLRMTCPFQILSNLLHARDTRTVQRDYIWNLSFENLTIRLQRKRIINTFQTEACIDKSLLFLPSTLYPLLFSLSLSLSLSLSYTFIINPEPIIANYFSLRHHNDGVRDGGQSQ